MSNQPGSDTPGAPAADAQPAAAAAAAQPTAIAAAAAAPDAAPDWLKGADPEVASWAKTKGYADGAAAAKAAYSAEKIIGNNIAPPKDGKWSPESLKALGVPEKPEGYQIARPVMPEGVQYDEGFEKAMLPIVHAQGLPPATVNALIEAVSAHRIQEMRNAALAQQDAQKQATEGLHAEFGQKTTAIINQAGRAALALEKAGVKGVVDELNKTGMGDNPVFIRAFAKVGEMMGEAVLIGGTPAGGALAPDQAKAMLPAAMAEPAYTKSDHPGHKAAVEHVARLNAAAYPEPSAA